MRPEPRRIELLAGSAYYMAVNRHIPWTLISSLGGYGNIIDPCIDFSSLGGLDYFNRAGQSTTQQYKETTIGNKRR